MMTAVNSNSHPPTASPPVPRSPWHSPVPYLFGGLAAMLGLIAFALLILACSYWRLSGFLDGDSSSSSAERDVELGEAGSDVKPITPPVFEEKILVIMAGQEKPTFLATPISSRASSFASNSSGGGEMAGKDEAPPEKPKLGSGDQEQARGMENQIRCRD
ncbi:protein GLUTAMINE DUMPER 3 [Diospyros lotus]|uniref:protein GLUTAMINE DUMPER 3 n=1 Tax=Diospyros lotus TaxID=55363 RepID=UPI0022539313|nr:protein GLUTAMINE DUMPER 3 [Diospyros lotus]